MAKSSSNFLMQGLKLVSACPICKKGPTTDRFFIESSENSCIVHVTCKDCGHAILAKVNLHDVGVSCVGIMTDLAKGDLATLFDSDAVEIDDVLRTHESLSSGEFLTSFQKNI